MMDKETIRMQAKIYGLVAEMYGIVAEIEGMKAENARRESRGEAVAYNDVSFFGAQNQLNGIADTLQTKI